jgi:hypothetical protein
MFQTRVLLGGMSMSDRYQDWRLDVDNMTYEVQVVHSLCSISKLSVPLVLINHFNIGTARIRRQNWICEHRVARGWNYSLPKESQTPIIRFFPICFRNGKEVQYLSGMSIPMYALAYSSMGLSHVRIVWPTFKVHRTLRAGRVGSKWRDGKAGLRT